MIDVTSSFKTLSLSQRDLMSLLAERGWEIESIEPETDGFSVKLKSNLDEKTEEKGSTIEATLAQALLHISSQPHFGASKKTWVHQLVPIAIAYAQAPIFENKAAISWKALADDSVARLPYIQEQIDIEYTREPAPYETGHDLAKDVKGGKIKISILEINDHPIWTPDQVLAFRVCYNILGKAPAGSDDSWPGVNVSASHYLPYLSSSARQAAFTEIIGRKAYLIQFEGLVPRKIVHLTDFLSNDSDLGVHPLETLVPLPNIDND